MSILIDAPKRHSGHIAPTAIPRKEHVKPTTISRKTTKTIQQVIVVMEPEHDLGWLNQLKGMYFDPILMDSNFDAVQQMTENLELRLVVFAQRSAMMDGITACQLLRQSRSEADAAIVLLLDEKLDESIAEAFAAGASDVVCQPYCANELVARLDATRQRLQLWNDIESPDLFGAESESSFTFDEMDDAPESSPFGGQPRSLRSDPGLSARAGTAALEVPSAKVACPSPPTASLLLGDWLLTHDLPHGISPPALDLSQLKFVPTLPASQIEGARKTGKLSEVLLDRVWVCPQCRALPSFRPACPCCGSAGVERDRMLHHFACAFVGSTGEFQVSDEGLACPKCCTQRLMVGTDCEFLDGPWRCSDCDWNTAELEIVGHCLKCGFRFPAQQAAIEDLMGHHFG